MTENESDGVYDDSMGQPQVESSAPDGGGVGSRNEAGGNKRDPISSSPTMGDTIAGRTINTGTTGDITNAPSGDTPRKAKDVADAGGERGGGTDTGASGVTGQGGTGPTSNQPTNIEPKDADVSGEGV